MKKVFLSYSRKNLDEVQEIASILCAGGIRIWQDIQSLAVGNTEEQNRVNLSKHKRLRSSDTTIIVSNGAFSPVDFAKPLNPRGYVKAEW